MVVVAVVVAVRRNNGTRNGWMYGGRTDRHTQRRRAGSTAPMQKGSVYGCSLTAASCVLARRSSLQRRSLLSALASLGGLFLLLQPG